MPPPTPDADVTPSNLQQTLTADPNNHFNLGLSLWQKGEESVGEDSKKFKKQAAEEFLASAKLVPGDGAAFRYLGHFYSRVSGDSVRGAKCYQRAVGLNPDDFEAGEGLCDLLDGEGKESLEVAVCKEAAEKSPRAFWAFRRLGYLRVHQKRWSEAVPRLQHAIRGYPTCADLWEALGLAYHRMGMFTAAIKAYGRAVELESSRVFALTDSGYIQLMLGSFRKGVEQFRCALELAPQNLSVLYGLASGLLAWAKDCIWSGAFTWGTDLLKEALEVTKTSIIQCPNSYSSWKLHGDIEIALSRCFPWEDGRIDKDLFSFSIKKWKSTCHAAAKNASHSYQRALHLAPWRASIYNDIAISLDLVYFLEDGEHSHLDVWQLPEKMSLGGLMLEGDNKEFWFTLGSLSGNHAAKQHALVRGLQLDVSLSSAWACLGKLYRNLGDNKLARLAFDHARSFDPLLALPWAGMAADYSTSSPTEAFESCLRAVQNLPLAEFQVGLGILAALSGHLLSPQVFVAIQQAVQRAPDSPEAHNLNGLVLEAREDYEPSIAAYRQARCALNIIQNADKNTKSNFCHVSINLARSLCKSGRTFEAIQECEDLKAKGLLDDKGMQIYTVALWKAGQRDLALATARKLVENISAMKPTCADAALGLLCTLTYNFLGKGSVVATIQRLPRDLLHSVRMNFIVSALNALGPDSQLQLLLPAIAVKSHDVVTEMHSLTAISKMINQDSKKNFTLGSGIIHLRKILHMHPDSTLLRNQLSSLLLSSGDSVTSRKIINCNVAPNPHPIKKGLRLPYEIYGAAGVACAVSCSTCPKFSFSTCKDQVMLEARGIHHLQRWLHQEPWNHRIRFLLILNLFQKAREEQFPQKLCVILKDLISDALSTEKNLAGTWPTHYREFLLHLCVSEINLQFGDYLGCINHASEALRSPSCNDPFFVHLQLCRAYASMGDLTKLENEFSSCLKIKTTHPIGWIILKYIEFKFKLPDMASTTDMNFKTCIEERGSSSSNWTAIYSLARAQAFVWDHDYLNAEEALSNVCVEADIDSCLLLCHGALCMELVRQQSDSKYLSRAVSSLRRAQEATPPLPIVSLLLAQAEASLGAKSKWESNLRFEWFTWPAEMRPAELYFQMHLLARQSGTRANQQSDIETVQSPEKWILRAIHLNPSCSRYWKILQKIREI